MYLLTLWLGSRQGTIFSGPELKQPSNCGPTDSGGGGGQGDPSSRGGRFGFRRATSSSRACWTRHRRNRGAARVGSPPPGPGHYAPAETRAPASGRGGGGGGAERRSPGPGDRSLLPTSSPRGGGGCQGRNWPVSGWRGAATDLSRTASALPAPPRANRGVEIRRHQVARRRSSGRGRGAEKGRVREGGTAFNPLVPTGRACSSF